MDRKYRKIVIEQDEDKLWYYLTSSSGLKEFESIQIKPSTKKVKEADVIYLGSIELAEEFVKSLSEHFPDDKEKLAELEKKVKEGREAGLNSFSFNFDVEKNKIIEIIKDKILDYINANKDS